MKRFVRAGLGVALAILTMSGAGCSGPTDSRALVDGEPVAPASLMGGSYQGVLEAHPASGDRADVLISDAVEGVPVWIQLGVDRGADRFSAGSGWYDVALQIRDERVVVQRASPAQTPDAAELAPTFGKVPGSADSPWIVFDGEAGEIPSAVFGPGAVGGFRIDEVPPESIRWTMRVSSSARAAGAPCLYLVDVTADSDTQVAVDGVRIDVPSYQEAEAFVRDLESRTMRIEFRRDGDELLAVKIEASGERVAPE